MLHLASPQIQCWKNLIQRRLIYNFLFDFIIAPKGIKRNDFLITGSKNRFNTNKAVCCGVNKTHSVWWMWPTKKKKPFIIGLLKATPFSKGVQIKQCWLYSEQKLKSYQLHGVPSWREIILCLFAACTVSQPQKRETLSKQSLEEERSECRIIECLYGKMLF